MILEGDNRKHLPELESGSVNTCVTSPPFFGLRDYGHEDQIGLEPSPDEYIEKLVGVFQEVKRVLRDDGTLWLNIGDSYATNGCYIGDYKKNHPDHHDLHTDHSERYPQSRKGYRGGGIKAKDLIGIPWMLAFALRADGWYLRNDIIWHKPNPTPESVTDRCTKSHEHIFLLAKSKTYYCDMDAIKEQGVYPAGTRAAKGSPERYAERMVNGRPPDYKIYDGLRNKRDVWTVTTKPYPGAHFATFPPDLVEPCVLAGCPSGGKVLDPFAGSGTVGEVALKLGRKFIGIELNPAYAAMARKRVDEAASQPIMF